MATAPTTPQRIAAETRQRINSPLHKLRGTIRRYMGWEALALAIILLGSWFWIGLTLDYGAFKIAGVDWVQVLPHWLRWATLIIVAGGITLVLALTLLRLLREFRPEALALVLERRFPKILGDQLITAVELSDLDQAETYGYSRAMIIETVRQVSEKVDQVPVTSVFNWGRLYRRWMWAILVTLGVMLMVALAYLGWRRSSDVADFGYRFADVSGIWAERNLLMRDTLWPRRAMLEIVEFPDSGELRIGRDAPSPRIRVRALKWVVADHSAAEGWRSMIWADLTPELLGGRVVPTLPTALLAKPSESASSPVASDPVWTVDRVELLLEQDDVRKRLLAGGVSSEDYQALRDTFEVLGRKAAQASMSRTLRKLEIPKEVKIYYWGAKSSDEAPMARQQQGVYEYAAVLTDLKESVKFYVKGEDYSTYPYRRITLVPPPTLTRLERDEFLPAYQFYRLPADGVAADLKGKRQIRRGEPVSLTGGTSRIEIASGSDLVLRGTVDKPLAAANIRYRTAGKANEAGRVETLEVGADQLSIGKNFGQITQPIEFDFEFTDTDNVKSLRHVIIQPVEDKSPDVNVSVAIIRKTTNGYMCTPQAMIPFEGNVRDDVGLARVEYSATYSRVESAQVLGLRAAIAAGILGSVGPSPAPRELLAAAGVADYLGRLSESRETIVTPPALPLKTFEDIAKEKDQEFRYGKGRLPELLQQPPPDFNELRRRHITQFDLKPNLEYLDLQERLPELQRGLDETIRPRYRLRLTIQAVDNNIDTGPRTGQNKETFTFIVVPYEELLAEMNKDEEAIAYKAQELYDKMVDVRNGIDKVVERMPRDPGSDEFRSTASRMDEILAELEKGSDTARELLSDAQRLLKEAQTNRVPANYTENREKLVALLDEVIRIHFERARDAHTIFRDVLNQKRPPEPAVVEASRTRQDELLRQLEQIRELVSKAIDITRLAKNLQEVIEAQRIIDGWIKAVLKDKEDIIEHSLGELEPKAPAVELQRGEKKTVILDLGRDQFVKGRFQIKPSPPPESELAVGSVLAARLVKTVPIDIAAGQKAGTFAVPVTFTNTDGSPLSVKGGKPFVLQVIVK